MNLFYFDILFDNMRSVNFICNKPYKAVFIIFLLYIGIIIFILQLVGVEIIRFFIKKLKEANIQW